MAAYNITADPEYGDFMSLAPDSLRRKRIDQLAGKIYASMYEGGRMPPRGQQRSSPDPKASRGDEARKVALKQAIAQEKQEQQEKPDFDALDRSVGAQGTAKEAASFLPTAPAPTIASETTGAAKPTATGLTGDQLTQRILDQDAALVAQEAKNPLSRLPAAPAPAAQAMPTTGTAPVDEPRKSLLERLAPNVFGNLNRSAADDVTGNIAEAVDPSKFSAGGLSREEYYQRSVDQAKGRVGTGMFGFGNDGQDDVDSAQERLDKFRFYEEEPTEDESASAGVPRVSQNPPAPSASDLMRASAENTVGLGAATPPDVEEILRPQNKFTPQEQLDVPDDVDAMGMDLEGMAPPEKAGLLSRLGGFAQNNPELLAQIAQAGGGFMQDIAQGRAQKKADAKTRGAMAQSNLIGALTGGKSRPAVMREEAEQGGLLARLGQAVEIGGSVAGGEMKRRTALSQRGEEMGLERDKVENAAKRLQVDLSQAEAQKAHQGRMLELQKLGLSNDLLIAQAKAGKKDKPPQKVYDAYLAANSVMSTVSTVEELMKDAGLLQAGTGLMAVRWLGLEQGLPQSLGGDKTREITAAVNRMVQTLGEDMSGILSNQDIVFLKQQAPSDEDSMSTVIKKADLIRKRVAESIRDRAGVDADYFNMTPFGGLIDSVAAQGEQAPGDLAETLGQTEIKL